MKNLQVQNITLSFGEREILKNISFNMAEHTRAALTGANGSGKSTLLKCISGSLEADEKKISITKGARLSYLPQSDIVLKDQTIYQAAEEGYNRFNDILKEIEYYEERTQLGGEEALAAATTLSELHDTLLDSGFYDRKKRIETILLGLGFKNSDFNRPCREFSGGYQMRVALAKVLVENPDFLFLDEPTNYLDIEAMTWLLEFLSSYPGGIMIVSHDQDFLDNLVTEVYELFNGNLTRYSGNYTKYTEIREQEIIELEKAAERQKEEIEKTEVFIERFRYKATKAKQVQSRIKSLDKIERIEIPGHLKKLKFSFPPSPHSGNDVLKVNNLSKAYGTNTIYSNLSFLVNKGERLAITGRNGAGKSTLLRILAGVDTEYSGNITDGAGVIKGYFAQEVESTLNPQNDLIDELRTVTTTSDEPRLRGLLGAFLFSDDDVYKKIAVLSGGEKSRLALLKILIHPSNLLLLDEPTNHLDINAKEMLSEAIKKYEGTVIFVSHDKHFIKSIATRILYVTEQGPIFFDGDYEYFERKLEEKEREWQVERSNKSVTPIKSENTSYTEQKQNRNKIKSLEREIDKLSSEIEELENKISELDEESAKVENYSKADKIRFILKEKEDTERIKDEKENIWLEKSEELEELKNGKNC